MPILCVILARAGSKGLPRKNVLPLMGKPLIAWTIEHARASRRVDRIVLSTDGPEIAQIGRDYGVEVIDRPADLACDTATVDSAARHAVESIEQKTSQIFDTIVILYGNVPLRPAGLVDAAIEKLHGNDDSFAPADNSHSDIPGVPSATSGGGGDSVQSVCPVGKAHPYWMKRLGGESGDRLEPYQENTIYRRQDLPPVYLLDGGVIAVRRECLFTVVAGQPHAFLGRDRRAIVTGPGEVVDVDGPADLALAEAILVSRHQPAATEHSPILIAGRSIGTDHAPYVIAELGVNHDGSVERALALTRAAHEAGAQAVKLQLFDPALLLSRNAIFAQYQQGTASDPFEMLSKLQLSAWDMVKVRDLAHTLGLGFVVTCFSRESVPQMKELAPDAVKVASPDAVNLPLIESLLTLDKPLLISTGACEMYELIDTLTLCRGRPTVLLQCVSAYPTPTDQASIGGMDALRRIWPHVGYSDHTEDFDTGFVAAARGACVIEKHLTHDRFAPGPDHGASLDPDQFRQYIDLIQRATRMLGPAQKLVLDCERDVRTVSRQSLCAVRNLAAGHILTRDDLTIKRPGTGIPAAGLNRVIGRTLRNAVQKNCLLKVEDLQP